MTLLIKNFTIHKINQKYLNKIADKALRIANIKNPIEISLVITGEKRIKSLNKKYRNIDKITDVLSFGNEEAENKREKNKSKKSIKFINPPGGTLYLGEIFICYPQAEKQARRKKHSAEQEIMILLIHGILHLAGFDHKKEYEKSEMKVIEEKVLESL